MEYDKGRLEAVSGTIYREMFSELGSPDVVKAYITEVIALWNTHFKNMDSLFPDLGPGNAYGAVCYLFENFERISAENRKKEWPC